MLIGFAYFALFMIFGVEPQITWWKSGKTRNFNLTEYMQASAKVNGNGLPARTVTLLAYPGAKVGRLIYNAMAKEG